MGFRMSIEDQLHNFREVCREKGLKITRQRLEIFMELFNSPDHPTVEKLYQRLHPKLPAISLDTIYRTLTTLEKHDLVSRVDTGESQARYEGKMEEHSHAICKKCGGITDFYWKFPEEVRLPGEMLNWGRIIKKSLTLHGLCGKCAQEE
jgi:Fur family peroxide stress response transcriptional regulator